MSIDPFGIVSADFNPFEPHPFASYLAQIPLTPSNWTTVSQQQMRDRFDRRVSQLQDRIDSVVKGRVIPDVDDVSIGSGSQLGLAILFLDICAFSQRPNWEQQEQKEMLALMHLFMSEMITIVRQFQGHFEKNTGDGLMAYFGEGMATDAERVKPAVEAATYMHYYNDNILSPVLDSRKVARIKFRVGIDVGPVTLARLGVKSANSEYNSMVAIGTIANVANKLMKLIPDGGICIGEHAYKSLPNNWGLQCTQCESSTEFIYRVGSRPYPAWVLNYRLSEPTF